MTTTIENSFPDVPTTTPVLEMQGITKRFHGVSALQNVNDNLSGRSSRPHG